METITNFIINNLKKLLIALICIIILICGYLFINYKVNFLHKTVVENRDKWDLFLTQNTIIAGDSIGIIYEKDYDINNIPSNIISMLFVDYYISHEKFFFNEKNTNESNNNGTAKKILTMEEVKKTKKALFGPDYNINLESVNYGCNRSLKKSGDTYEITAQDPEMCGMFSYNERSYISYISNYYRNDKDIIINLKIAYLERVFDYEVINTNYEEDNTNYEEDFYDETLNENNEDDNINYEEESEIEDAPYVVYKDKTKKEIINHNYPPKCVSEEDKSGKCYEDFQDYEVTLKKASDGKYYFYSIKKQ